MILLNLNPIRQLKEEGKCPEDLEHQQVKYLTIEWKLKRLINPVRGFQSMKTAYATFKGFE
jgi:IS6 family transposase